MSRVVGLLSTIRFPSPVQMLWDFHDWIKQQGMWWATSVTVHAVILSTLLLITVSAPIMQGEAPKFEAPVETEVAEPPVEHFDLGDPPLEPTELNTDTLTLTEAPAQLAQDEQINTTADDEFVEAGGSMASANSDMSLGGMGFDVKAVGPGAKVRGAGGLQGHGEGGNPGSGGAGSGFGGRGSGVRKAMLGAYGGTKGTERAVAAALNWLSRHQNPDGSWSISAHTKLCKDGSCTGLGAKGHDGSGTPFALLPFFAAGQTHKTKGPYRNHIGRGLYYLTSHQKNDGDLRLGSNLYTHGLATICLSEAYGLSGDKQIGASAQAAINYIVFCQDPAGGGWRYGPKEPGDTSAAGWQIMALKSGLMAGLSVPSPVLEAAARYLTAMGDGSGGFGYTGKGRGLSTSAVGLLCSQYMGKPKNDPIIEGGVKYLMRNLPNANKNNCYYYYYATQVMHNVPGSDWDVWNRQMRKLLIESQAKTGCATGSWDPTQDQWGKESGGRMMVTSLNCLTLEVYYRYLPLYQLDGKKAPAKK